MIKRQFRTILRAAMLCAVLLCQTGFTGTESVPDMQNLSGDTAEMKSAAEQVQTTEATVVYLGVYGYGAPQVTKENKPYFRYRFLADGQELVLPMDNGGMDALGEYDYPLQNRLKEGYTYRIQAVNGIVTDVEELAAPGAGKTAASGTENQVSAQADMPQLPVRGTPGVRTLRNFLATAMEPVGHTLYIYGGGWDWQDKGSALQTRTIGISPDWVRFFRGQNTDFTYKNTSPPASFYPFGGYNEYYYAGLDCSGYLGWVLYNTLNRESGGEGYVGKASAFARNLSGKGFGTMTEPGLQSGLHPGDIVSIDGHVWISLGTCSDGSVVILHSTPSLSRTGQPGGGVQIGAVGFDENCEAYLLADHYMSTCYPEWYERYPAALKGPAAYLYCPAGMTGRMVWDVSGNGVLTDPEGVQSMTPETVLRSLFGA